jgi:hypothetical protein
MTALEFVQLLIGSGVFTGGVSAAAWVLRTERRLMKLELETGVRA